VTKRLQTIKRKMLVDRHVRAAYEALGDEFDLARELIAARVRAGLTQAEVAERMSTTLVTEFAEALGDPPDCGA